MSVTGCSTREPNTQQTLSVKERKIEIGGVTQWQVIREVKMQKDTGSTIGPTNNRFAPIRAAQIEYCKVGDIQ